MRRSFARGKAEPVISGSLGCSRNEVFQALKTYSKSTSLICHRSKSGMLSPLDAIEAKLATPLKSSLMPSREASLRNLARAKANWRPPRPWRSRSESRLIRSFVWHWCLGHGPWCSGRALARWLGVSHTYIQKLTRTLSRNENDFLREVAFRGIPTVEGLRRAREESQQQRERGLLRTQRRWRTVEHRIGNTVLRDVVPTKPNAATLVANNPFLADAPTPTDPGKLDYTAVHMWNVRMNAAREAGTTPLRPAPRIRWRPGKTLRPR